MEMFEASNGVPVRRTTTGTLSFTRNSSLDLGTLTGITGSQEEALREFFQHERDQELGRWRDPELPHFYVINDEKGKPIVVDERSSRWTPAPRDLIEKFPDAFDAHRVAARYFAAHPEPKPWHDAKPGEVWLITDDGATVAAVVDSSGQFNTGKGYCDLDCDQISAGRRIWPEVPGA